VSAKATVGRASPSASVNATDGQTNFNMAFTFLAKIAIVVEDRASLFGGGNASCQGLFRAFEMLKHFLDVNVG
jgi:hypothetical protein